MLTLGPHLSQNPFHFSEQLRQWQPPVGLVLMDVIPESVNINNNQEGLNLRSLATFLALKSDIEVPSSSTPIDDKLHKRLVQFLRDNNVLDRIAGVIRPINIEPSLRDMTLIGRIYIDDAIVENDIRTNPEDTAWFHHHLVMAIRSLLLTQRLADRVHY